MMAATMPRPTFGRDWRPEDRYPGAGHLGSLPIVTACPDPTTTRARQRRADELGAGTVSPCYRCLAARPETRTGCHFTERMDRP